MRIKSSLAAGGLFSVLASAASAGGFIAPVAEPQVVVAPAVDPVSDWNGAYGGVSLGYSFGSDDEFGLEIRDEGQFVRQLSDLANTDIEGFTGGIHGGYRWQRGSWVFGPELAVEGGSVKSDWDDVAFDFTVQNDNVTTQYIGEYEIRQKMRYIATLALKAGYTINPETLIYGTAGYTRGGFTLEGRAEDGSSGEVDYNADGYALGLGFERKINARMSAFAEWQYRNYGRTDVTFEEDMTLGTPEHHNIKVGVNFQF